MRLRRAVAIASTGIVRACLWSRRTTLAVACRLDRSGAHRGWLLCRRIAATRVARPPRLSLELASARVSTRPFTRDRPAAAGRQLGAAATTVGGHCALLAEDLGLDGLVSTPRRRGAHRRRCRHLRQPLELRRRQLRPRAPTQLRRAEVSHFLTDASRYAIISI